MTKHVWIAAVIVVVACGHKKPQVKPDDGDGMTERKPPAQDESAQMIKPETMDEITRLFQRKGDSVSRCLAFAVDNKELPKNSHGKVTLDVTIAPSGKISDIKIIKASLESKSLHECIIGRVKEIEFPALPKPYPTTYTYAFEAM